MKNKLTAALLAFFLGGFGVHQFYLGKGSKGIMYLLFFWTFIPALIALIDFIILLTMSETRLRFKQVNYKWSDYDDEYQYYSLETKADNEL